MKIPDMSVAGSPAEMKEQLDAHIREHIILVFRNCGTAFSTCSYYGAEAKRTMHQIIEALIGKLKKPDVPGFWEVYNSYMNHETDIMCEILEEVFAKLEIDTVDPLSEMLQ